MRMSLRALELCRVKFSKEKLHGFEQMDESVLNNISEESAKEDFDELTKSEIICFADGDIHISALGQHILNMMLTPEQYMMLDSDATNICVRVYIRDVYYLCVLEDKTVHSPDSYDRLRIELLPRLDLVIGSFAFALAEDDPDGPEEHNIRIVGKAWDQDRCLFSELSITGKSCPEKAVRCQMSEKTAGGCTDRKEFDGELSGLINHLTRWMFGNISSTYEREGL